MSAPRVVRTLTAVLAADMVGYSRLMDRDERVTFERLKAHRKEVIESLLAQHRGRMVKLTGDGALCDFQSVVDAVACAILIQQAITSDECSRDALHSLERAIGLDPVYAQALGRRLGSTMWRAFRGWEDMGHSLALAKSSIRPAVAADEDEPWAYLAQAMVVYATRDDALAVGARTQAVVGVPGKARALCLDRRWRSGPAGPVHRPGRH